MEHGQTSLKKMSVVHGISDDPTQYGPESVDIAGSNGDLENTQRRLRRQSARPSRFSDYELYSDAGVNDEGDLVHMALMARTKLIDVDEALTQPLWKEAMIEELKSIEKNKTWSLVDMPPGKHCIGVGIQEKVESRWHCFEAQG